MDVRCWGGQRIDLERMIPLDDYYYYYYYYY